jgi:hypothetical protein
MARSLMSVSNYYFSTLKEDPKKKLVDIIQLVPHPTRKGRNVWKSLAYQEDNLTYTEGHVKALCDLTEKRMRKMDAMIAAAPLTKSGRPPFLLGGAQVEEAEEDAKAQPRIGQARLRSSAEQQDQDECASPTSKPPPKQKKKGNTKNKHQNGLFHGQSRQVKATGDGGAHGNDHHLFTSVAVLCMGDESDPRSSFAAEVSKVHEKTRGNLSFGWYDTGGEQPLTTEKDLEERLSQLSAKFPGQHADAVVLEGHGDGGNFLHVPSGCSLCSVRDAVQLCRMLSPKVIIVSCCEADGPGSHGCGSDTDSVILFTGKPQIEDKRKVLLAVLAKVFQTSKKDLSIQELADVAGESAQLVGGRGGVGAHRSVPSALPEGSGGGGSW